VFGKGGGKGGGGGMPHGGGGGAMPAGHGKDKPHAMPYASAPAQSGGSGMRAMPTSSRRAGDGGMRAMPTSRTTSPGRSGGSDMMGKGGHGGHGGHGHHGHGGRGRRWGGGGWWDGGYDYPVTIVDMSCPAGTMWQPEHYDNHGRYIPGQCVPARPVGGTMQGFGARQHVVHPHIRLRGFGAADGTTGVTSDGVTVAKKMDWTAYAPWGLVGAGALVGLAALAVKKHGTKQMLGWGGLALGVAGLGWVFLGGKPAMHPTDVTTTPSVAPDGVQTSLPGGQPTASLPAPADSVPGELTPGGTRQAGVPDVMGQ
jgi:hypothetical protein